MNKKRNLLVRFLGCGVMIALAGAMALECTVKDAVIVLYNDAYHPTGDNAYWIIGAELWEKNYSARDVKLTTYGGGVEMINDPYNWIPDPKNPDYEIYDRFYLEYGEAVAFSKLDLLTDYFLVVHDYDYNNELVYEFDTGISPAAARVDTTYYAYRRGSDGKFTVTWNQDVARPSYPLSFPKVAPISVALTDKTAIVDEQINTGRKAPTRKIGAPKQEKLEGEKR